MSKEFELVVSCSQMSVETKQTEVKALVQDGDMDWELFVYLAFHHRLFPLIYRYLSVNKFVEVPTHVLEQLRFAYRRQTSKTFQMIAGFLDLIHVMEYHGIRVTVMKGFPIAQRLYGDVSLRPSRDLDILIEPEDVFKVQGIAAQHGFQITEPSSPMNEPKFLEWMKSNQHIEIWHPEKKIYLEIHWRLGYYEWGKVVKSGKRTEMDLAGKKIKIINTEELLIYLMLHGAFHSWFRLHWLKDIDVWIRSDDFSWNRLYQLAEKMKVNPVLNQTLLLTKKVFDTPLPEAVYAIAVKDLKARKLAKMAMRFIYDHDYSLKSNNEIVVRFFRQKTYQLYLHSRWMDRLTYLARSFLPAAEDHVSIALPGKLYFLYYFISPVSGMKRRIINFVSRCT